MSDTLLKMGLNDPGHARIKFYCDDNRCIDCHGCDVACKEAHHLPVGINKDAL